MSDFDDCDDLVRRRGRKSVKSVKDTTKQLNKEAYSHRSIVTDPINDAKLVLDLNHGNLRSLPSRTTIHNHANLPVQMILTLG